MGRGRNFAVSEYTHTLRLTSELVELRVWYANPIQRLVAEQVDSDGYRTCNYPLGVFISVRFYLRVCDFLVK